MRSRRPHALTLASSVNRAPLTLRARRAKPNIEITRPAQCSTRADQRHRGAIEMKGKVAFIPGEHKIEFHEFDVPTTAPAGGLITDVTQSNVCGSEVHMWRTERAGGPGRL